MITAVKKVSFHEDEMLIDQEKNIKHLIIFPINFTLSE
jgi:hypothetical protein